VQVVHERDGFIPDFFVSEQQKLGFEGAIVDFAIDLISPYLDQLKVQSISSRHTSTN
jgi:hypothetical protein